MSRFQWSLLWQDQIVSGNKKRRFPRSSPIPNLNPFLAEGILRVGGHLENAPVSFEAEHPVILPTKHHVTNLIIQNCRRQQEHYGPSQVLACIRKRFWIVLRLSAVRRVLASCMNCGKQNTRPGEQIVTTLPAARVAPSDPPFTHVGVDYFGPEILCKARAQ